ncbi:hypothetical protein NQ314_010815 [Rhamnusium bicolor]|uniref:Uncharacterized protein n=1 Tax=Rhamnusium bicolor TaxID=1586634 RepID=A0AAV8XNH4_9CUCU|nr:hypothetical protein NQ314_010815 [Rhamnusium bicolor]
MAENLEEDLPRFMKQKIERNRQKAIIIKRSKLVSHPYTKGAVISEDTTTIKIGATKYKDTGGGFLLEEEPEAADIPENVAVQVQAPIFEPDRPTCEICHKQFATSWLFDNFTLKCCDTCRMIERCEADQYEQVEKRALEVWGSEEKIEEERERREEKTGFSKIEKNIRSR